MAFVTDSNRPQPLGQPPPIACLTASGTAFGVPPLLMHPWSRPPPLHPLGLPGRASASAGGRRASVPLRHTGLRGLDRAQAGTTWKGAERGGLYGGSQER